MWETNNTKYYSLKVFFFPSDDHDAGKKIIQIFLFLNLVIILFLQNDKLTLISANSSLPWGKGKIGYKTRKLMVKESFFPN